MVPSGWDKVSFEELATFRNGLNFTKSDKGESIKIVGVGDFKDHSELKTLDGLEKVSVANDVKSNDLIESGDVLYVRSNGNKELIGRCLFFPNVEEKLSFSGFTIRGRTKSRRVLPNFLAILSRSEIVKQQFLRNGGGTNISNLSQQILNDIVVPLPPIDEQQKIAKVLSTWDKAISTTENLIENSKQQKKALMQQLLTGKKRLLDESGKPFEGEWEEVKLGDVVSTGRGFAFKSTQYSESGYKIVRVTNIDSSGSIDLSDCVYIPDETACEYKKYELLENDVLLVMVGATAGKLGFVTKKTLPALLNQNMWSLRTKDRVQLCQLFLKHVIYGVVAKYLLSQQGSARGFFTQKTFELVKFSIPSIQEQQKIASVLTNADQEIKLLKQQLSDLKQEKKALMQQLLTGKRRVTIN